jgi:type VI secretion system protein VasD
MYTLVTCAMNYHWSRIPSAMRIGICCLGVALFVSGCSTVSAVQVVGTAVNLALETAGLKKKTEGGKEPSFDVPLSVSAGDQLNTTDQGQSLSLVIRIYQLRTPQAFKTLTYEQASNPDAGKGTLGEDLISYREVTLVPGKIYDLNQKVSGDETIIGVVGLFRAPYGSRWKLAFDAKDSSDSGITIGAHACALTAGKGTLDPTITAESARTLSGIQCNG